MSKILKAAFALTLATGLSGCAAAVVGGVAVAGLTVAQERSVGSAMDDTVIDTSVNSVLLQEV